MLLPQLVHNLFPTKMVPFLVSLLQAAQASQLTDDVEGAILVKHLIMVLQVSVHSRILKATPTLAWTLTHCLSFRNLWRT